MKVGDTVLWTLANGQKLQCIVVAIHDRYGYVDLVPSDWTEAGEALVKDNNWCDWHHWEEILCDKVIEEVDPDYLEVTNRASVVRINDPDDDEMNTYRLIFEVTLDIHPDHPDTLKRLKANYKSFIEDSGLPFKVTNIQVEVV